MESVIQPFDWQRMLFGNHDLLFGLEILFRTLIVYAYALVLLRWLGSRTIGQLSTVEFLLVIALGSAVGDSMFYPDVPLVHALLVVTIVVVANKLLDMLMARSRKAEEIIDGKAEMVIENGVICADFLKRGTLGRSEIFQQLRRHGVRQLGQVEYAFVEPDGVVSVFPRDGDVPPGLPIVPPWEVRMPPKRAGDAPVKPGEAICCMHCGAPHTPPGTPPGACSHCGSRHWTEAVAAPAIAEPIR